MLLFLASVAYRAPGCDAMEDALSSAVGVFRTSWGARAACVALAGDVARSDPSGAREASPLVWTGGPLGGFEGSNPDVFVRVRSIPVEE